jgi:hypothetical protein
LTEYEHDGRTFSGEIEAQSWTEAELILRQIRPDEKVIGELVARIEVGEN